MQQGKLTLVRLLSRIREWDSRALEAGKTEHAMDRDQTFQKAITSPPPTISAPPTQTGAVGI